MSVRALLARPQSWVLSSIAVTQQKRWFGMPSCERCWWAAADQEKPTERQSDPCQMWFQFLLIVVTLLFNDLRHSALHYQSVRSC